MTSSNIQILKEIPAFGLYNPVHQLKPSSNPQLKVKCFSDKPSSGYFCRSEIFGTKELSHRHSMTDTRSARVVASRNTPSTRSLKALRNSEKPEIGWQISKGCSTCSTKVFQMFKSGFFLKNCMNTRIANRFTSGVLSELVWFSQDCCQIEEAFPKPFPSCSSSLSCNTAGSHRSFMSGFHIPTQKKTFQDFHWVRMLYQLIEPYWPV